MTTSYAALEDIWGVPSFSTPECRQAPEQPANNPYKNRSYQSSFLKKHRPVSEPMGPAHVLASLYDSYGMQGILRNLPGGAVRELRDMLEPRDAGMRGMQQDALLTPALSLSTVASLLLCGFVALIVWDVLNRARMR